MSNFTKLVKKFNKLQDSALNYSESIMRYQDMIAHEVVSGTGPDTEGMNALKQMLTVRKHYKKLAKEAGVKKADAKAYAKYASLLSK